MYGDGVFTMAVMRVSGGQPDSMPADHSPTHVWESDGISWAVVGSLPNDLLAEVLAGLPAPDPVTTAFTISLGTPDEMVIVALTFVFTLLYVVARMVLEVLYLFLDPRVRY